MFSSYKHVLLFALPVALSNITAPLLGIVDTAVLGHLDSAVYLSGVAIGAELYTFVTWMFGFLRMGTTAMTAPALGQGDGQKTRDILTQALFLSVIIGVVLIILSAPVLYVAARFYGASPDVLIQMRLFFWVRVFSAPATLANLAILGWLLGLQKAKAPLILLLVTNSINIVLDLWFVRGLGLDSIGVALGSLLATYSALLLSLYLVYRVQKKLTGHFNIKAAIQWRAMKYLLVVNRQLFVRTLCLLLVFLTLTAWGAREGTNVLAANTLLLNLLMLSACFLDGIANASEAQIGKTVGERDLFRFYTLLKTTGICSGILVMICMLILWAGSTHFIMIMTSIQEVRSIADQYYIWLILMPLAAGASYWLDGVFIGLGRTDMMQAVMVFSVVAVFIPACFLLYRWGNDGLWIALIIFMCVRSLSMAWVLRYQCIPEVVKTLSIAVAKTG